jgi:hypothetical protein
MFARIAYTYLTPQSFQVSSQRNRRRKRRTPKFENGAKEK